MNEQEPHIPDTRSERLAGRLLDRFATRDAAPALTDLLAERDRALRAGRRRLVVAADFWWQVAWLCLWNLRERARPALRGDEPVISGRRPGTGLHPMQALKLAVRGLQKTPGIAVTAAVTLSLGLSATVVLLGVFLGTMRPLPVPDGDQIVSLDVLDERGRSADPPVGVLDTWSRVSGLSDVAAVRGYPATIVHPSAPAVRVAAAEVTPDLLSLLQMGVVRGRALTAQPDDRDAALVAWELWQDAFEADPDIIGRTVRVGSRVHTVVGVMPPDFGFPENQSFWTVMDVSGGRLPEGTEVVARLSDGSDPGRLVLALERGLASLARDDSVDGPYRARVQAWVKGRGEGGEAYAFIALGILVALLLIVCAANVSTLLLVRATERVSVLAVHAALGASRSQVVLQLLIESLMVAMLGGAVGLAAGYAALEWIQGNLAVHWGYYWMEMGVRPGVVLGTFAAVTGAAALAGTAPALLALRTDLRSVMGGRSSGSARSGRRLGRWFLATQVTLSTVGLVAALVMGGGVLTSGDLMADLPLDEIVQGRITPDPERYPSAADRAVLALLVREAVEQVPGVTTASVSVGIPVFGNLGAQLRLPGDDPELPKPQVFLWGGDAHTPETYGLELHSGRLLTDTDGAAGSEAVVVVNDAFVKRWFDGGNALGRRLNLSDVHGDGTWATVVGVVSDHYPDRPGLRPDRVMVPLHAPKAESFYVSARTGGDPAELVPALRRAVANVDPTLPLDQTQTLRALTDWMQRMPRSMALFGALGGLAGVLVAGIGLYGIVAFQVRSRLRETGVRMALGAPSARILTEILRESLVRVLPATAIGLALAYVIAPGLAMFAFGRPPRDVTPFVAAGMTMLIITLVASFLPALRASRTEPQHVLRSE